MNPESYHGGWSTLELIISFAIFTITFASIIVLVAQAQDATVTMERSREALRIAEAKLDALRAQGRASFDDVVSEEAAPEEYGGVSYTTEIIVSDISVCAKRAQARVSWETDTGRKGKVNLETVFAYSQASFALGADCSILSPRGNWNSPRTLATVPVSSGRALSLDALNSFAYLGTDSPPYLEIIDARDPQSPSPISLPPTFTAEYPVNSIDVVRQDNRTIAYLARESTTSQFAVLDVTDPFAPALIATRTLAGVDPLGGEPGGNRVSFFEDTVFMTTRNTAGPEFHVFSVQTPESPSEFLAAMRNLNLTVTDMAFSEYEEESDPRIIGFFTAKANTRELLVYDVTDSTNPIEVRTIDFPGIQDGGSVFALGKNLYVGRQFTSDNIEFFVFQTSELIDSAVSPAPLTKELSGSVRAIRGSEDILFFGLTQPPTRKLQVWPLERAVLDAVTEPIGYLNISSIRAQGMDYEDNVLYAINDSGGTLWIIGPQS